MIWVLFAAYLTTAGAAVDLDGTPRNFISEADCIQALQQAVVRMKEEGVYVKFRTHVGCTKMRIVDVPQESWRVKRELMFTQSVGRAFIYDKENK